MDYEIGLPFCGASFFDAGELAVHGYGEKHVVDSELVGGFHKQCKTASRHVCRFYVDMVIRHAHTI
jgi:hypothetical protein